MNEALALVWLKLLAGTVTKPEAGGVAGGQGFEPQLSDPEDATAVGIGGTALLAQMELWLRSQFRRGNIDASDYQKAMDDIYGLRRRYDKVRAELAEMRKGDRG